jgi:hypothetical protein
MAAVIVLAIYTWAALRWISLRKGQWRYLVYSSRSGWYDFVTNNVLPALPDGVGTVAIKRRRSEPDTLPFQSLLRAGDGVPKPYLATVRLPFGVRTESLNIELWQLKKQAARNDEVQRLLRMLLTKRIRATRVSSSWFG